MKIFLHSFFSFSIQGLGTDEDTLNEILASRTNREIREINRVYKEGKFECPTVQVPWLERKSDTLFLKLSMDVYYWNSGNNVLKYFLIVCHVSTTHAYCY